MNANQDLERDSFVVEYGGVVATIHMHHSTAGWSVHVMTAQDPHGDTIFFGHGMGVFATIDQARDVGTNIARQRIEAMLGRAASGGGFTLRAGALERQNDRGNFDGVIEVFDSAENLTDRHFIKIINNPGQTRDQARETARRGLDQVSGVDDQGRLVI